MSGRKNEEVRLYPPPMNFAAIRAWLLRGPVRPSFEDFDPPSPHGLPSRGGRAPLWNWRFRYGVNFRGFVKRSCARVPARTLWDSPCHFS